MRRHSGNHRRCGFTLVELLVVIGIIALLISILLPALNRAKKAANTAACLSNLREMGQAWMNYLTDNNGQLPYYIWHTFPSGMSAQAEADNAWHGYWIGILADYAKSSAFLLCPEASTEVPGNLSGSKGFGLVNYAWSGVFQGQSGDGPVGICYDNNPSFVNFSYNGKASGYRIGSYAFNFYMLACDATPGHKYSSVPQPNPPSPYAAVTAAQAASNSANLFGAKITNVQHSGNVPMFYDSVWIDNETTGDTTDLAAGSTSATYTLDQLSPVITPPVLTGSEAENGGIAPWRYLLNRHNEAINICAVDGHAETVPLSSIFQWTWFKGTLNGTTYTPYVPFTLTMTYNKVLVH